MPIQRSIARRLSQAVGVAQAVAAGNLSRCVEASSKDEVRHPLEALATADRDLSGFMRDVRAAAETVQTTSREIAVSTAYLSHRTQKQAARQHRTPDRWRS